MNEQAVAFGESGALFGILSLPAQIDPTRPAVLIPNTGDCHRVGPGRMHVELARALAAAGVVCLRFDNAGLGDSERVPGRAEAAFAPDLRSALDALDARAVARGYIVIGFASGAHDAHQAARVDPRIVGAVFLDGYTHRTPLYWINRTLDRLTHPHRHANAELESLFSLTSQSGEAVHDALPEEGDDYGTPTMPQMLADLTEFVRRELWLFFIYTGQMENEYNYATQLLDAFPLLHSYPRLSLRHLADADHSFERRATRERVVGLLVDWVVEVADTTAQATASNA